jgi:hypothetical protein
MSYLVSKTASSTTVSCDGRTISFGLGIITHANGELHLQVDAEPRILVLARLSYSWLATFLDRDSHILLPSPKSFKTQAIPLKQIDIRHPDTKLQASKQLPCTNAVAGPASSSWLTRSEFQIISWHSTRKFIQDR